MIFWTVSRSIIVRRGSISVQIYKLPAIATRVEGHSPQGVDPYDGKPLRQIDIGFLTLVSFASPYCRIAAIKRDGASVPAVPTRHFVFYVARLFSLTLEAVFLAAFCHVLDAGLCVGVR